MIDNNSLKAKKKVYNKRYNRLNKDKIKLHKKEYRLLNKDKIKKQKKEYNRRNKNKIIIQQKKYRLENRNKIRERNKEYNKKYVGITTRDIETRWKEHKWDALNSNRGRSVLRNSIVKYGIDNFKIELVDELYNITEEDLLLKECHYIEKYKTMADDGGYNLVRKSNQKLIFSEATKRKMSAAQMGENNGYYGKKHTEEIREKMRGTRESVMGNKNPFYGKRHSKELQDKITASYKEHLKTHAHARLGKTFTEESRKKMSLAQIGKRMGTECPSYDSREFEFQNQITGELFVGTGYDFRIKYNLHSAPVSSLKTGRAKSYRGWIISKRP